MQMHIFRGIWVDENHYWPHREAGFHEHGAPSLLYLDSFYLLQFWLLTGRLPLRYAGAP
jgi:hypothetical protein